MPPDCYKNMLGLVAYSSRSCPFYLGTSYDRIMSGLFLPASLIIIGFVFWLVARIARRTSSRTRNLPPGPKGLPIVGDVFHIADHAWLASPQRKDEYGDITTYAMPPLVRSRMFLSFRRDHVCKCAWTRYPRHKQPTRRHRSTRKTLEHTFRSPEIYLCWRDLNEAPRTPHDTIW